MPLFDMQCPNGHVEKDVYLKVRDENSVCCPTCGQSMEKLPSLIHTDLQDFHTPIEMHSIGCTNMRQIREMQEAGVPCSDDPRDPLFGTPVARNRSEKKKALKVAGFVETN
jgi:hypothetical protein